MNALSNLPMPAPPLGPHDLIGEVEKMAAARGILVVNPPGDDAVLLADFAAWLAADAALDASAEDDRNLENGVVDYLVDHCHERLRKLIDARAGTAAGIVALSCALIEQFDGWHTTRRGSFAELTEDPKFHLAASILASAIVMAKANGGAA